MEITKEDRDKLRDAQRKLNDDPIRPVGGIIEHKVQNPKTFRTCATNFRVRSESRPKPVVSKLIDASYSSKYKNSRDNPEQPKKNINYLPLDNDESKTDHWLNMNNVELDKLEWMFDKSSKANHVDKSSSFDKNGRVTDREDEGHTLDELVQLLDSTYEPQVTYALRVISRICDLCVIGYYDGAFSENIHEVLVHKCTLRVRHHLDSPNMTLCMKSLECLRSLICNTQVDEVLLDRLFPVYSGEPDSNLWLSDSETQSEFSTDLKDLECVKIDSVQTLLQRTNLKERISFLLGQRYENIHYEFMIDILIRMARHSVWACLFLNDSNLMKIIGEKFLPNSVTTSNKDRLPIIRKVLKFLRIIGQGIYEATTETQSFVSNIPTRVMDTIAIFYHMDCSSYVHKDTELEWALHLESLRSLKTLFNIESLQRGIYELVSMNPEILFRNFKQLTHLDPTYTIGTQISLPWQLAAHIVDFTGHFGSLERHYSGESKIDFAFRSVVKDVILSWINQVISDKKLIHIDPSIAISMGLHHTKNLMDAETGKQLVKVCVTQVIERIELEGNEANFYQMLIRKAAEVSQLDEYLNRAGTRRDPEGLPSYGFLQFNETTNYELKINPTIGNESPYMLLSVLMHEILQLKAITKECLQVLVNNQTTLRYLTKISNYHTQPTDYERKLQASFLCQCEIKVALQMLSLLGECHLDNDNFVDLEHQVATTTKNSRFSKTQLDSYSKLCSHTISLLGIFDSFSDSSSILKDKILERILFNQNLHYEIAMENFQKSRFNEIRILVNLSEMLNQQKSSSVIAKESLKILLLLYSNLFQSGRYWVFDPLTDFYKSQVKLINDGKGERSKNWFKDNVDWRSYTTELEATSDTVFIASILKFNFSLLLCSPHFSQVHVKPNVEEYLSILACIFLDDDLFHDEAISQSLLLNMNLILQECVGSLSDLRNDGSKQGLFSDASKMINHFELPLADVFTKLVEQYESVSYGNYAFANFLLLFMTPRSDKFFKKIIFQDKADTFLPIFRISIAKLYLPKDLLFSEREPDSEVRTLIRRARNIGLKDSVLQKYCQFHGSDIN